MSETPTFQVLVDAIRSLPLPDDSRIIVAVSGGADSVALFRAILSANSGTWQIRVVHIDHALRGPDSRADSAWVIDLARSHGIECDVVQVNVGRTAQQMRSSVEMAARALRYESLHRSLESWQGTVIALGHSLNDQAETVVIRLLRGTGPDGLAAMSLQAGKLVRPFLSIERKEILAALDEIGQAFRTDTSNDDRRYLRNAVRHDVMPLLRSLQPAADRQLTYLASQAAEQRAFLRMEVERCLPHLLGERTSMSVSGLLGPWRALHPALRTATLRATAATLLPNGETLTRRETESLLRALDEGKPFDQRGTPGHDLRLRSDGATFTLERGLQSHQPIVHAGPLRLPGTTDVGTGVVTVEFLEEGAQASLSHLAVVRGPLHALIDADIVGPMIAVRSRMAGDKIQCLPGGKRRKVQDLMVDARVPKDARDGIPLVVGRLGISWIPGLAADINTLARPESTCIVHLAYRPHAAHSVVK